MFTNIYLFCNYMFARLKKQCIFALALLLSDCVMFIENIEIDSVIIMLT